MLPASQHRQGSVSLSKPMSKKTLLALTASLIGLTAWAQDDCTTYMSMADPDAPPSPVNWCPECIIYSMGNGLCWVNDNNSEIPPPGWTDAGPDPGDGDTNAPALDRNFFYIVGNGCPGGTNHPANVAPVGWVLTCPHSGFSGSWPFWEHSPASDGNGDRLDVLWHYQCTNHGASWAAFTLYGVHYDSTNDVWTTNSIQAYQTNYGSPYGRWFFNEDPTNIPLAITNGWYQPCTNPPGSLQGLPGYTNSCDGAYPGSNYLGYVYPPLDSGGGTNVWPFWYWSSYPPGPVNSPYSFPFHPFEKPPDVPPVIDFGNFVVAARGGENCSYSMQVSTNLSDWYSCSISNAPMGDNGTNWVYCNFTNIVSGLGMTTNDPPWDRCYWRLKYEP